MKKYLKPDVNFNGVISSVEISSLNDWLSSSEGAAYKDAGIITYIMVSE